LNLVGRNRETINKDGNSMKYRLPGTRTTMRRSRSFHIKLVLKFAILLHHITTLQLSIELLKIAIYNTHTHTNAHNRKQKQDLIVKEITKDIAQDRAD
jgi:hypothetical protein